MDKIENYIREYRSKDAISSSQRVVPRLPFPLPPEDEMRDRFAALYYLEVEKMGHHAVFDSATNQALEKVAHWFCASPKRGLLLLGTMGNGKTTMLWALRDYFGTKATRRNAQDIYDAFRDTQNYFCLNDPLLLIDDLGTEPLRCIVFGQEYQPLAQLLLHRYDRQLTTIIATNLLPSALKERYGDRFYDRMMEMYEYLEFTHPSYRGEKMISI